MARWILASIAAAVVLSLGGVAGFAQTATPAEAQSAPENAAGHSTVNAAASAAGSGSVTGHVLCTDTQRPGRFAVVGLIRKLSAEEQKEPAVRNAHDAAVEAMRAELAERNGPQRTVLMQVRTGLDGSFTVADVPAGDYYAAAVMPGYVLPLASPADEPSSFQDRNAALKDFPVVHVAAGHTSTVDLSLQRGGSITGRITFDDGSPVPGAMVRATTPKGVDPLMGRMMLGLNLDPMGNTMLRTDDEGRYRIVGLPPGKYIVQTTVPVEDSMRMVGTAHSSHGVPLGSQALVVFAPHTQRQGEAKAVEIRGDDAHSDVDIEVDLNGLHSVRGRVLTGSDHHPAGLGFLELRDKADDTFSRDVQLRADGSFQLDYVPAGTYELVVLGSGDAPSSLPDSGDGVSLIQTGEVESINGEDLTVPVLVAEHDVALGDLQVPPKKAAPKAAEPIPQ